MRVNALIVDSLVAEIERVRNDEGITLAELLWLAEQVTGTDAAVLAKAGRN